MPQRPHLSRETVAIQERKDRQSGEKETVALNATGAGQ
jgi:hypothetical protein